MGRFFGQRPVSVGAGAAEMRGWGPCGRPRSGSGCWLLSWTPTAGGHKGLLPTPPPLPPLQNPFVSKKIRHV